MKEEDEKMDIVLDNHDDVDQDEVDDIGADQFVIPLRRELLNAEVRSQITASAGTYIHVIDKEKMINENTFLISTKAPEMVTLRVFDSKNKFKADTKKITLVPG